ncbi:MAG: hypothetical protein BWK76_15095 [Desulfobulbaceae bacterium A2]|nr:MAG: hypothetical protein BWK76_15095 [Desulfobulbaceae bacterium A2]
MCLEVRKRCQCGGREVQFHLRDNIMTPEVILRLFCPSCAGTAPFDQDRMLRDNGWIIEYDIELAQFLAAAKLTLDPAMVGPDFLFDEGYATWREMYPGEQGDILQERQQIMGLIKNDPRRYLQEIQGWNIARVEQLKRDGWRKALHA